MVCTSGCEGWRAALVEMWKKAIDKAGDSTGK
jgi:hypothetical protein